MSSTHPRVRSMVAAQFADGFGGRFHGVLLGLYVFRLAGLEGFAGFATSTLVGSALAVGVAGALSARLGGRATMLVASYALIASRVLTYALLPLGLGVPGIVALRLIGASAGNLVVTASKGQVAPGDRASMSLAWLNLANGAGQTVAALVAALLVAAPVWLVTAAAAPVVVLSTLPTLRLARYASATPVPLRDQLGGLRAAAGPALTGCLVFVFLGGLLSMSDGVTTDLYGATWLGPLSVAAFGGSVAGTALVPALRHARRGPFTSDVVLWSTVAALGLAAWAWADRRVAWLLGAMLLARAASQVVAALVEARVIERVGSEGAVPALMASSSLGSLGGAFAVMVLPRALDGMGFGTTAVAAAGLLLAVAGLVELLRRHSSSLRLPPRTRLVGIPRRMPWAASSPAGRVG